MILTDNGNARAHVRSAPGISLSFSHFDHEGNITGHPVTPTPMKAKRQRHRGKKAQFWIYLFLRQHRRQRGSAVRLQIFQRRGRKGGDSRKRSMSQKAKITIFNPTTSGGEQGTAGQHPHILHCTCLRSKDGGTPSWEAFRLCWWINLCYRFHTQKFLKYLKKSKRCSPHLICDPLTGGLWGSGAVSNDGDSTGGQKAEAQGIMGGFPLPQLLQRRPLPNDTG